MPIPSNQGLSPQEELEQWAQWRKSVDPATLSDPKEVQYYNGPSARPGDSRFDNPLFSKDAGSMFVNAKNHFDPSTGKVEDNKGFWQLPETYKMLALMGGSVAAPFVLPALGGLTGSTAPASLSASEAGAYGGEFGLGGIPVTAGGKGILGKAAHLLGSKAGSDMLGAAANGIGQATNAAANNRGMKAQMAMQADAQHELELQRRATEEQQQRSTALKNASYADYTQNVKPGPFNTAGIRQYGPAQQAIAANLQKQAQDKLATGPAYDTNKMSPLTDPKQFVDQYGNPSTMEKVGNWASPTLSVLSKALRFF
jgi:hypothetical protein